MFIVHFCFHEINSNTFSFMKLVYLHDCSFSSRNFSNLTDMIHFDSHLVQITKHIHQLSHVQSYVSRKKGNINHRFQAIFVGNLKWTLYHVNNCRQAIYLGQKVHTCDHWKKGLYIISRNEIFHRSATIFMCQWCYDFMTDSPVCKQPNILLITFQWTSFIGE